MSLYVGIGGWTFEPWRGTFFPEGVKKVDELRYASRHVTSIEVNGTFYRTQSPATFRKWFDETPDQFVFALKAPRFAVNRRVLAEAAPSIETFVNSGIAELGHKLGPILWQFAATKRFDAEDFSAFLDLLPEKIGNLRLRHAIEPRHESFRDPAVVQMLRERNHALVYAHAEDYLELADVTADFVYARLQQCREDETAGYSDAELAGWAERTRTWQRGGLPDDLPVVCPPPAAEPRDVFVYFISGAKVRAPMAAQALIRHLDDREAQ
jgi:uncharacterized protein YecE (DUF72 family)